LPDALQAGCRGPTHIVRRLNIRASRQMAMQANWMKRPGVRERIAELKEASSRRATLSREQTIEFLCSVILASAAKVDVDSSLVQSAEFENGQPVKLRIPDKIAAVKELTKMCGWAQPNRIELSARDTLAEFIDSIRQAPRRPGMAAYAEDNGVRTAI
jgi:hypothetical protein